MKISKLFHWLYALVMLLPIFAIGVTCGYAMFNKNAYQSYASESINQNEKVFLDSSSEIDINTLYYSSAKLLNYTSAEGDRNIYVSNVNIVDIGNLGLNELNNFELYKDKINRIYLGISGTSPRFTFYYNNEGVTTYLFAMNNENTTTYSFNIDRNLDNTNLYQYFYYIEYHNNTYLSEAFYYSIDRVTQSNLFNWAYDSFLVAPFTYIVSLFSMPSNSPVVMLLSYWLAISIIWLVFDLVMYVPLLVHRWLDKGVIE